MLFDRPPVLFLALIDFAGGFNGRILRKYPGREIIAIH